MRRKFDQWMSLVVFALLWNALYAKTPQLPYIFSALHECTNTRAPVRSLTRVCVPLLTEKEQRKSHAHICARIQNANVDACVNAIHV